MINKKSIGEFFSNSVKELQEILNTNSVYIEIDMPIEEIVEYQRALDDLKKSEKESKMTINYDFAERKLKIHGTSLDILNFGISIGLNRKSK